jgi:DASS family divalent anion:Na+ symporter
MKGKSIRALVTVIIPALLLLTPVPTGLPLPAWHLFAIYIGAILGLMLRPVPEAVVLLVTIAISSIFFKNTSRFVVITIRSLAWPIAYILSSETITN